MEKWRGGKKRAALPGTPTTSLKEVKVLVVRIIYLVQALSVKPRSCALVQVQLSRHDSCETLYCVEVCSPDLEAETGLIIDSALLEMS